MDGAGTAQRVLRIALVVALALIGLWVALPFVPALLWAIVLAIAVAPVYARAEARWPAGKAVWLPLLFTAAIGLAVLVPLALGIVRAAREAHDLALWLASARAYGIPEPGWAAGLPFPHKALDDWWASNLGSAEAARRQLGHLTDPDVIARSRIIGTHLVRKAVVFAFTLLAFFFMLRHQDGIAAQARRAGDRLFGPAGERIGEQMIRSVRGTIDGLVLVGIGEGALMAVAYIAAGVPHPVLMGALTAVAAMIPFAVVLVIGGVALVLLGQGAVGAAIAIVVIGVVVVFIADHFVRPVLIGGATRLPFLWVLIGILGGVEAFGLLGLFIGPAVMAALILLWRELVAAPEADPPVPYRDSPGRIH
ncbi:AI-2E family transporter [Sphingomonas sp. CGMCC 1.13658]|nr:AI-2E family transporter [Sphingomonas sp. CGMCC 1.13658]